MKVYKSAVGLRGDMLYCPLAFYIDSYWTCEPNCAHCYLRRLNRTWGEDFRAADPAAVIRKLQSTRGTSPLHRAIQARKTIRFGNRADPFQACEETLQVSTQILAWLAEQDWDVVVETKFPQRCMDMTHPGQNCTVMAIITVGMEQDWELFEHKRTEPPRERLRTLRKLQRRGVRVGANGEPFIPGYHTVAQFEDMIKLLKANRIPSYNVYNLHLNDLVAKNLCELGLDIEKIWRMNQDAPWRKVLRQLLDIAAKHDIILGCPDFVNAGWADVQRANTCCGVNVQNPCTFNAHHFKLAVQRGADPLTCWDGVGVYAEGAAIVTGAAHDMYTLKDVVGELPR